jgi:hypothetical protein
VGGFDWTSICWEPRFGSSLRATAASRCTWNGICLSDQFNGQEYGTPVVMFDGSCNTLISARSECVIWRGESIAGGPRSTLKTGSGTGMSIGEEGNGTRVAGSLILCPSLAGGDAAFLVSCELRTIISGSCVSRRLDASTLLRKTCDTLPRPEWRECRLRFWRRDAMADLEVGDLPRADCLSGVVHLMAYLMDGTLGWSSSTSDVLCSLSVAVA